MCDMCVQVKKMASLMKPYFFSDHFKPCCKTSKLWKGRRRRRFWLSGDFLVWYFRNAFHATRCFVGHEALENEWYVVIKAYKFTVFFFLILRAFLRNIYPTLSMLNNAFVPPLLLCNSNIAHYSHSPVLTAMCYRFSGKEQLVHWIQHQCERSSKYECCTWHLV